MQSLGLQHAMKGGAVVGWVCGMSVVEASTSATGKLRVVCTTTLITDLVKAITGDVADVTGPVIFG